MTYQTSPRVSIRNAFKALLEAANLGVTIHKRQPNLGADPRSVVLTIVTGSSRSPSIGLRRSADKRALEMHYRLQVDCYSDESDVDALADKVEQTISDAAEGLRSGFDIHDLRKSIDSDTLPAETGGSGSRVMMEFTFYTHRELTR